MRNCGARFFGFVKAVDSGILVDVFRAVVCDHSVEVEGDAEFLIVLIVLRSACEDLSGRITFDIRLSDVRRIRGEKQGNIVRRNVFERGIAGCECGTRNVEIVMLNGVEDPLSGIGVVVAEQDDFDRLAVGIVLVHGEQSFDEGERHALSENVVLMFQLIGAVCGETFFAEHGVRLVEFKECAGGDSDHQFVFYSECHF